MTESYETAFPTHERPRVFVADDDPSQREFLKTLLAPRGYDISAFDRGEDLLDAVFKNPPDLILLDVMLPEKNGYEICKAVRENRAALGYIPVLLVSVLSDSLDRTFGSEAGADDFISIPFVPEELVSRIKSLLRTKKQYDQMAQSKKLLEEKNRRLLEMIDRLMEANGSSGRR
ncbi:MAG: response regulator [Deltaproteobacteria bacterium]|nr:response regulator [Deltaproteobacteria bacterium]